VGNPPALDPPQGTGVAAASPPLEETNVSKSDASDPIVSGEYTYVLFDGQAVITDCAGNDATLILPDQLDGYDVMGIARQAFLANVHLVSITIPSGITRIGSEAFFGCTNLTEVSIPSSVTIIGVNAFSGCDKVTLRVEMGSAVWQYATENDIPYVCVE
jgi:hypothetical protein